MFFPALKAEFTKLLTTKIWWILAIILFLYVAGVSGGLGALFGFLSRSAETDASQAPPTDVLAPMLYGSVSTFGYVFPVLLGALAITSEYRHQMLTPTFLATPKRGVVLAAKSVALLVFGALYGVIGVIASVGAGAGALALFGLDAQLGDSDTWALMGRAVLALALWAVIGVGLGALIPNQVAAIVVTLAFTQFVEPTLRAIVSFAEWAAAVGKFLPGAASDALLGAPSFFTMGMTGETLEWWQGGLLLAALALVLSVLGYFVSWKRDVT
ncbi:ABC transporter permease [Mycetocola zhadangensis]|uniref:ABC transporter permease n=1 Tax=Mycetocola zhadangensis TaxID=1164595 RepID=A0A3L7J867_9MICO|nr:ABC transporter permease [Mycetocola zhadangensis]